MGRRDAMTKSKRWTRKLDVSKPTPPTRMPVALMLRMFLVGSVAVGAAGYAIYRHYYVARPSMLMPVPPSTELPAPELTPLPPPR